MFFNIILDELVTEFELKVRVRGWIILFNHRLVESVVSWYAFLSYYKIHPWSITDPFLCTHRRFCFYGFNDCNSVHYQCEQKSVMLILCLHLLPIDNVFLRRRNARWWTTVYVCLHGPYARTWWEQLDSFSGHNHPDHIHRRCYAISREWNITNSLGACKFVISSNASWYSKKLMNRVDFSEPPLHGCKWC